MKTHVQLVAGLHLALGAFLLLVSFIIFLTVAGGGLISGDRTAIGVTLAVSIVASAFVLFLTLPGIIGSVGLLQFKPWGRMVMLVVGAIGLLSIPFGTILGIYTLWVLLNPEVERMFAQGRQAVVPTGGNSGSTG